MVMAPIRNGWEGARGSYLTPNNVFLIGRVGFSLMCCGEIVSLVAGFPHCCLDYILDLDHKLNLLKAKHVDIAKLSLPAQEALSNSQTNGQVPVRHLVSNW